MNVSTYMSRREVLEAMEMCLLVLKIRVEAFQTQLLISAIIHKITDTTVYTLHILFPHHIVHVSENTDFLVPRSTTKKNYYVTPKLR